MSFLPDLPWGTIAVAGIMIWSVVTGGRPKRLDYFKLNPALFALNVITLAAVVGSLGLIWFQTNGEGILWWSWVKMISGQSGSIYTAPLHIPFFGWLLMAALVIRLPDMAYYEEVTFRATASTLKQMVLYSAIWAALHILVGIPLIACIAIGVFGGLVFNWLYQNWGLEIAARAHFQQNLIVIGFMAVSIAGIV